MIITTTAGKSYELSVYRNIEGDPIINLQLTDELLNFNYYVADLIDAASNRDFRNHPDYAEYDIDKTQLAAAKQFIQQRLAEI